MAGIPLHHVLDHLRQLHRVADAAQRSDRELLHAFATHHDEDAFAVVVRRHAALVWGVCRRILGHQQDAEDAFQATFVILARRAGSTRWRPSVGAWLHTVAQRLAVHARRQIEQRRLHEREASRVPQGDSSLPELAAVVDEELQRLPAKYREPLLLHYLEGMTAEAAARQLGLSRGTLYNRLAYGRELLRERLSRQGLTLAAPLLAAVLNPDAEAASRSLIETTLRGVMGSVPEHVAALAAEALGVTTALKLKMGVALALLLGVAAGGAAMLTPRTPMAPILQAERANDPPKAEERSARRVDRYGDPLPELAVRRFGTLRLRNCGAVVFSPDGKYIVTGGGTKGSEVVFWDRRTGKEARRLKADAAIRSLLFTPDGQVLAAMTATVFSNPVWDVTSGKVLFRFKGEYGTFTRDGSRLLGVYNGQVSNRPTVGAWKVATGMQAGEWTMPANARGTCCSPDGKTVAYRLDDSLVVYDLATRAETRRWPGEKMRELTFSPDGRRMAAASMRGLRLWKVANGQREYSWDRLVDSAPCFSADGKRLAWTGYDERSISYPWVVEIGRGETRRLGLPINNLPSQLAFSPDGATLAVPSDARALELREVATGKDALPLDANTGRIFGLQLSPDGRLLATLDTFRVLVWDKATGKLLRRFPEDGGGARSDQSTTVWDVRLGDDGRMLRGNANSTYGHWEEVGPAVLARLRKLGLKGSKGPAFATFGGTIQDVLESPGGRYVAVRMTAQPPGILDRSAKPVLRVWDTQTGLLLEQVRPPERHLLGAFSPDRRLLATTAPEGTIHLWDLVTGEQRLRLPGHRGCSVRALLFTPDNRSLFSGGDDSQVLLWDLTARALDGVWRTLRHDPKTQSALWDALAAKDAAAAHRALWELAADPAGTVAFLRGRLKPATRLDDKDIKQITALIAQLDADSFAQRDQAQALLRKIGEPAVPALRRALTRKPGSLEQARRLEQILKELVPSAPAGDALRSLRAVEILERIATPAARRILSELAQGRAEAELTQTAKESLGRLEAP
jgi:RNA polymerase sigma factor (sigma-70 family)